jgi:hypothetical protein
LHFLKICTLTKKNEFFHHLCLAEDEEGAFDIRTFLFLFKRFLFKASIKKKILRDKSLKKAVLFLLSNFYRTQTKQGYTIKIFQNELKHNFF